MGGLEQALRAAQESAMSASLAVEAAKTVSEHARAYRNYLRASQDIRAIKFQMAEVRRGAFNERYTGMRQ